MIFDDGMVVWRTGPTLDLVEHGHFERLVGGDGVHNTIEYSGGGRVALLAACAQMVEDGQ